MQCCKLWPNEERLFLKTFKGYGRESKLNLQLNCFGEVPEESKKSNKV